MYVHVCVSVHACVRVRVHVCACVCWKGRVGEGNTCLVKTPYESRVTERSAPHILTWRLLALAQPTQKSPEALFSATFRSTCWFFNLMMLLHFFEKRKVGAIPAADFPISACILQCERQCFQSPQLD